jgi:putative transposase
VTQFDFAFPRDSFYKQRNPADGLGRTSTGLLTNRELTSMATADIPPIVLTYKFRLLPTRKQHEAMERILEDQRILYNSALAERIDCFRKIGKSISYYDQCKSLTAIRAECDGWADYPAMLQRGTLARLHESFQGFFRRVKKGDAKAGFPRFKGRNWFKSFEFTEWSGITLRGRRIRFKGLPGSLRVHMHRALPSDEIRSCIFKRDARGWHVCLAVRVAVNEKRSTRRAVGIDMGISTLAMLSTGEAIPNPKIARNAEKAMRLTQRKLARCKRGSNRRKKVRERFTRLHRKIANTRRTYLHQVSARLVGDYDLIAIEKLNVKGLAASILARDVHDAGWSTLKDMLKYKAAKAGTSIVEVDCRKTSQTCPECGVVKKKTLSQRIHRCECGCTLDRDHAAALVILQRGGTASRAA